MGPTDQALVMFCHNVWRHYETSGRSMPWRDPEPDGSYDPYKIMVSEVMLQQTQVNRVIPKYQEFLSAFPTVSLLAAAELGMVLTAWQGLGYNRRAKFLWQAAQQIVEQYPNIFPKSIEAFRQLPGIGSNTAAAICAYAYDLPAVFIETNIRTVLLHEFFHDDYGVDDACILPLLERTLPNYHDSVNQHSVTGIGSVREWYWALMDYGTYLKRTIGNVSRQSSAYTKQTDFNGSRRQIRGAVIRLLSQDARTGAELHASIVDERLEGVLADLVAEGLILRERQRYHL